MPWSRPLGGFVVTGLMSRALLALVLAVSGALVLVTGSVTAQAAEPLVVTAKGATTGLAAPGSYVSVEPGTWSPEPSDYSYQWLRDGVPIAGATTRDYLVQPADVGHALAPVVTGSKDGYEKASFTGAALTARKLTATVGLEVRKVAKPGQASSKSVKRMYVAIATVQAERPWPVAGVVEASVGKVTRVVGSAAVVRDVAVVKIPWRHVRQGKHKISVCFTGSDAIEAACAGPVTIREPRR